MDCALVAGADTRWMQERTPATANFGESKDRNS